MEFLVVTESFYDVDARKIPALSCYIANMLFGQQWPLEKDEKRNTDDPL